MAKSAENLGDAVSKLDTKAYRYEEVTQFDENKEKYTDRLSNIRPPLRQLKSRIEYMEFLLAVLTEVVNEDGQIPSEVPEARRRARSVVDNEEADYYQIVSDGRTEDYNERVRQVQSKVTGAMNALESELRDVESTWKDQVSAARNVHQLLGESQDGIKAFNDIEEFVGETMWDDDRSISSLNAKWQGLESKWEHVGIDWEQVKEDHGLSQSTIDVLKDLADGEEIRLAQIDETIASELLSVGALQTGLKLTA